jgi:hypothetical protein
MSEQKIQNPTVGVQSLKSQKPDHYHLTNRDLAFSRAMPCLWKKSVKSKKKLTQGAKNRCMNNGVYLLMNIMKHLTRLPHKCRRILPPNYFLNWPGIMNLGNQLGLLWKIICLHAVFRALHGTWEGCVVSFECSWNLGDQHSPTASYCTCQEF